MSAGELYYAAFLRSQRPFLHRRRKDNQIKTPVYVVPFSYSCVARKNRVGGEPAHIDVGDRSRSREEEQQQGLPENGAVRCRTPGCDRKPGRSCQLADIGMRGSFIGRLGRQTSGGPSVCYGSPPFSPPLFLCISLLSDDAQKHGRATLNSRERAPIHRQSHVKNQLEPCSCLCRAPCAAVRVCARLPLGVRSGSAAPSVVTEK